MQKFFLTLVNLIQTLFSVQTSKPVEPEVKPMPAQQPCEFLPKAPVSTTVLDTPNKQTHPGTRDIKYIIVHSTGGSRNSSISWFKNPEAKASAHYLIDKEGNLFTFATDNDILWHAGKSQWGTDINLNPLSIGIELENLNNGTDKYSDIQISVALKLCVDLATKYKVSKSNILRHRDIAPGRKSDPVGFPWNDFVTSIGCFLGS